MKIFGINLSPGGDFKITDEDKLWVEENFRWLKQVFGYPNRMEEQVLFSANFFPLTFAAQTVKAENVISDLCNLFGISRDHVKYVIRTDLRDSNDIPYQIEGKLFEAETDLKKGQYTIFIANSSLTHPQRLIYSLIYEFIRIRLTESEVEYDVGGDDTGLFIYLAGIYYGFGVILAQNLLYSGRSSDGMWEIKWNYGSEMPEPVMAFSLATYAHLRGESDPPWKNEFKGDFRKLLEGALTYLQANPNDLYNDSEVKANDLFNEANEQFERHEFDEAIATLQKILFLTDDPHLKADVYNNMGYYYMRKNDYSQAISNFHKALALGPEYGFANDNLGYALIMTGELEEGKSYLDKAMATANNDPAYTFRNFALYHQRRKELDRAEEFFQKAFDEKTPVDLLEYHYGEFLLERGETQRAIQFFRKSAEKQEEEGIRRVNQLKSE
ncbi:MAG TPA: tetratricopeptide repeat protein [Chryseosolibacter sp.]|nr:tetratricopeptide repeat protein [Chryseosolibacter sp.]